MKYNLIVFTVTVVVSFLASVVLVFSLQAFGAWIPLYPWPPGALLYVYLLELLIVYGMCLFLETDRWYVYSVLFALMGFLPGLWSGENMAVFEVEFSVVYLNWLFRTLLGPVLISLVGGYLAQLTPAGAMEER